MDKVTINGKALTTTYYAAQPSPTITRTTPAGRTSITELDADGRTIKTGVALSPNDPIQLHPTVYTYYQALPHKGRLQSVTQGSRVYTFWYDEQGYVDHVDDPLGRTVSYQYYPSGRMRTKTLPDASGSIVELIYDANGNATTVVPPRAPVDPLPQPDDRHRLDYGPLDFLGKYTPPKVDTWLPWDTTLEYTPNRLLGSMTKPLGLLVDPEYDSVGRLQGITGQQELSYSYYPLNAQEDHRGKLQAITSSPLSPDQITLGYIYQGNLLKGTTWSGAVSGQVEWTYDNDFRVTSETVQGSAPIDFIYADTDGLLTKAGDLSLLRDPATGILTGTHIGNLTESYGYNAYGELTDYEVKVSGATVCALHYTLRDALGRVVRKTESFDGVVYVPYEYHYSDTGELTDVFLGDGPCSPGTCTQLGHYEYSLNGNRTLVQHGTGQTISDIQDDAQDRLTKYGATVYQHFANGERSQKTVPGEGTTEYTWDVFGNLRRVELPSGSIIDYVIDGQNRRIGKKVNGVLAKAWLYDGSVPVAELDGNQVMKARFVYATKGHVPDYVVKLPEGKAYRLVTDQLGSVRLVVDVQTGATVQQVDYDEFGRVLSDFAQGLQPFGYAGGLYDSDTGLVRFGARDYDAETGRWLAKDPILFAGGDTNLYAYVGNDPINHIDPAGLIVQNPAMSSALGGGVLSWLGFGTMAEGLKNRADGMLAMSNAATFEQGLQKYRQGICQIGAGAMQAAGNMHMLAGAITLGTTFASAGTSALARASTAAAQARIPGSRMAHILERHAFGSVAQNAGKFAQSADIEQLVMHALRSNSSLIRPGAGDRFVFEHTFRAAIGINREGVATSSLRVVLDSAGEVITAFPF
jgi:RHS repeat-associated protein